MRRLYACFKIIDEQHEDEIDLFCWFGEKKITLRFYGIFIILELGCPVTTRAQHFDGLMVSDAGGKQAP